MSQADNKFDNKLLFLLKFRRFIPSSIIFQYFFIFAKYMPLFMISHDLNVHQGHYINSALSFLTITRVFGLNSTNAVLIALFVLILASFLYFQYYIKMFYEKVKNKNDPLADNKPSRYFRGTFILFVSTFILLNQNIYEILFSFFLCDGTVNPISGEVVGVTTCYDGGRYILIAISFILIVTLIVVNWIFNIIFFQPWFCTDCVIPSIFNGSNFIWTVLPLFQGYIVLEHNLQDSYALIIRYILRAFFVIYTLNFYVSLDKFVYISKKAFYCIIFMNTFNFVSIILEFVPMIADQLTDLNFVLVKLGFQVTISLLVLFIYRKKEKATLLSFTNWKKSLIFYELFNRNLYLIQNFEVGMNEKDFESIVNQFLEIKIIKNTVNDVYGSENAANESNKDLIDVYAKMKSLFKILKNAKTVNDGNNKAAKKDAREQDVLHKNKHKLLLSKLGFYITHLDDIFLETISDERNNEVLKFKNIILYSLFCNLIKRNYVSSFFFLEKLSFTRIYHSSFIMRLYYAQAKKMVCKDYIKLRVAQNEEKSALKKFFDNIKDFDKLYLNLKMAGDSLKDMTLKVNSESVNLLDFTKTMSQVWQNLRIISLGSNKSLRDILSTLNNTVENNALISKYVIFNDLVFKGNKITEQSIFDAQDRIGSKSNMNDKYVMAYLDENEDIYLLKVEKKTQALLGYDGIDIKGTNLLVIVPPTIGKYHKKITKAFTSSNQDFRRIDLFFITRDKYNVPFTATLIIFPMFDDRLVFFVMAELFNKVEDLNTGNPLQLPGTDFKCFAELNNQCEIVTINREYERVFGFNRDVIDSPSGKFNFFIRVLRLQPDKIFNRYDHVQHYECRIPFVTVFDNIKKLNYDEFREYSLEAYYKFKSFLTNFNLKRYPDVVMNIFIERRIIDRTDNDFFYYVVLSLERNKKTMQNIKGSDIRGESYINEVNTPHLEMLQNMREKKLMLVTQEIQRMSKGMLKEGSRLWTGTVKYSEITEFTGEDKLAAAFDVNKPKEGDNKVLTTAANETNIFEAETSNSALFKIKNFIFFLVLSLFLILFYSIFFNYINGMYNMALNIYELNLNILSLKNSQVMTAFLLTQTFVVDENLFPNITQDYVKTANDLEFYINSLNENMYQFEQTFSILTSDSRYNSEVIGTLVNNARVYKTIVSDFSIYMRNFTFHNSIDIFRLKVENFDYFDNMTFSKYPSEMSQNGLTFDINKINHPGKVASQGDMLMYHVVNNFIDTTIPLSDQILTENKLILTDFTNGLLNLELIFFIILFAVLIVFFIYLYDYFYSGKKYIYERYFVMFNILKFFTPFLLKKVMSFEELLSNYTKEKYEYFAKLDFDVSTENINSSLIRFDKENNSLIVFSGADKNRPIEKQNSLFASKTLKSQATDLKKKSVLQKAPSIINDNQADNKKSFLKQKTNTPNTPRGKTNLPDAEGKFAVPNDEVTSNNTNFTNTNNATTSPLKSMKSNNGLLNPDKLDLKKTSTANANANSKKVNEKDKKKKRADDDEEEEVDDAVINPRVILRAKNSFYFDFYFLLTIVLLFFILNVIFLIIIFSYTKNINSLSDYTNMAVDLSYSQIEISLIYLVTLLREKEIMNFQKTSIFQDKVKNFISDTNNIFITKNILTELTIYEGALYTPSACQEIITTYYSNLVLPNTNSASDTQSCGKIAGGIYAKGLVLGFESVVNNLVNSYNEKSKYSFKMIGNTLYDENIETVFSTRKEVLEKNIYNTMELIKVGTDSIIASTKSSLTLYYILFFILFLFLVLSYCFIYLFTKQSYTLLTKMETIIDNLLK